jgi:hypothetical protein
VALGNSKVQCIDLATGGETGYVVEDDAGRMTLSYTNQTTFETRTDGAVEYGHSDNRAALALVTPLENE